MHHPFAPVDVSGTVNDGETISLGNIEATAMATPGHTPGALSWTWQDCEDDDCKTLVYMDSLSPISSKSYRFSDHPDYVTSFKSALARLAVIPCDIALTPHPAASAIFERIASEKGLIDDQECKLYVDDISIALDRKLASEVGQ
jgi:metallo-beta-lactamase class B